MEAVACTLRCARTLSSAFFSSPLAQPPTPFGDATLVETEVPCSIHRLASMLFAYRSAFQATWAVRLGATAVTDEPWALSEGVATRQVGLSTPPPAAWGYLVGSTPIPSRRVQRCLKLSHGREVLVEEATHLQMPFGDTFHSCVQYHLAAAPGGATRLRVTFKLVFTRFAAMRGVLTSMVRGEHEKVFNLWLSVLLEALGGPASPLAPLRIAAPGFEGAALPPTPVAAIMAHAPHVAAVFASGALAGAAAAILCAAALHYVGDSPVPRRGPGLATLRRWSRLAEGAASGRVPHAGLFVRTVGRALHYARHQPLSLAVALLLLLFAAHALLRLSGVEALTGRLPGGRGAGAAAAAHSSSRVASAEPGFARATSSSADAARGSSAGLPAGATQRGGVPDRVEVIEADCPAGAEGAAPLSPAAAPPATPVCSPIAAPPDNPSVVRGFSRLLSRAGRDEAVADVSEVWSVLAGDLGLLKPRASAGAEAQQPAASAAALPGQPDDSWVLAPLALSPRQAESAATEWVHEHARFMPTLGWSHSYLLPTDRRRWSRLDTGASTDSLRDLVALPQGWRWADVWQRDMRGADVGAVDSEGWQYAVDFKFLHATPTPGGGRESTLRCVRRRRWVRARVPEETEALQKPQSVAASLESRLEAAAAEESTASAPEAEGWDVDLPPLPPPSEEAAEGEAEGLAPLLSRALAMAEQGCSEEEAATGLRAALLAFLQAKEAERQPSEQEPSEQEDGGSLWDLDLSAHQGSPGPGAARHGSPSGRQALVSTPERLDRSAPRRGGARAAACEPPTVSGFEMSALAMLT